MASKDTKKANAAELATGKLRSDLLRLVRKWAIRPRPSLGVLGERHAAKYLRKKGYRIVARNRRHREGEIDLIVMDKEFLVFVEVRTRASEDFMTPEMSIRHAKRQTVRNTVRRLIRRHKTAGLRPRIDVIAIIWPNGEKEPSIVRHHKGVIPIALW
jgi:putative endonuclease